jgi:hypothetical protein
MNKKSLIPSLDEMDKIFKTAISNKTIDKMVSLENTTNAYNMPAPKWISKPDASISPQKTPPHTPPLPPPPIPPKPHLVQRKPLEIKPKLPLFYYFFILSIISTLTYISITQRQSTNNNQFRTSTRMGSTTKNQNCSNGINLNSLDNNNNTTNITDSSNLNSNCNEVVNYFDNLDLLKNKAVMHKANFITLLLLYLFKFLFNNKIIFSK